MVDSAHRGRDPARKIAGRRNPLHQRRYEFAVGLRRYPIRSLTLPLCFADDLPVRRHLDTREFADRAPKPPMRQLEREGNAGLPNNLVPSHERPLAIRNVGIAKSLIQRIQRRLFGLNDYSIDRPQYSVSTYIQLMIVVSVGLFETALQ